MAHRGFPLIELGPLAYPRKHVNLENAGQLPRASRLLKNDPFPSNGKPGEPLLHAENGRILSTQ